MPAVPWATQEQDAWLRARIPSFLAARADGSTTSWYPPVYEEWLSAFPEAEPTDLEITKAGSREKAVTIKCNARRNQVFWWYQNHTRGTGTGRSGGAHAKVLKLDKRKRQMQPVHAYIKLHRARIDPIIAERRKEYIQGLPAGKEPEAWIVFYPRIARELLASEPDDVKELVKKFCQNPSDATSLDNIIPADPNGGLTPAQRQVKETQDCIEGLPRTLQLALDNIHEKTGWVGTIFLGGPDPRSGAFSSLIYHRGTTMATGYQWYQTDSNWKNIEQSFDDFVPKCYGPNHLKELADTYQSCFSRSGTPEKSPDVGSSAAPTDSAPGSEGTATTDPPAGNSSNEAPAASSSTETPQPASVAPTASQTNGEPATDNARPPSPEPNQFELDRENRILNNRALLESLGLTDATLGKPPSKRGKPSSRARGGGGRSSKAAAKATEVVTPRGLRSRDRDATGEAAANSPVPSPSESRIDNGETGSVAVSSLPQWMQAALDFLCSVSEEPRWHQLLDEWVVHERLLAFPTGQSAATRLSKTERPAKVDWWLRIGRRDYSKLPDINDVLQYSKSWKTWWASLQPDWRDSTWPPHQGQAGDWSALRRGGCNAVFLVIMALSWWYSAVLKEKVNTEDVLLAVEDMVYVFQCVRDAASRKRVHDGEDEGPNKRPALSPS